MLRPRSFVLALAVLAVPVGAWSGDTVAKKDHAPTRANQSRFAPFYSLPEDGTWMEYAWERRLPRNQVEKGSLRLSSVGRKEVAGQWCRWIEITIAAERGASPSSAKKGEKREWRRRKFLVAERPFQDGRPLAEALLACFHQDDTQSAAVRLSKGRSNYFLGMGIAGDKGIFQEVRAEEKIHCRTGDFLCRHVSVLEATETRRREYHVWLSGRAPFGWVQLQIREQHGAAAEPFLFTATASATGRGAKSELDESKVR